MNIPEVSSVDPAGFSAGAVKVDRALEIEGWMFPQEVLWLALQATQHRRIVELGSFLGRSTRALADNTSGVVLAVDDFKGPRDAEVSNRETILERFVANLTGARAEVIVCEEDLAEIDPAKFEPPFDMLFIDACHKYESVRRDIAKWVPFVQKGGLVCGHDFTSEYPGVMRAVLETFTFGAKLIPGTSLWGAVI